MEELGNFDAKTFGKSSTIDDHLEDNLDEFIKPEATPTIEPSSISSKDNDSDHL